MINSSGHLQKLVHLWGPVKPPYLRNHTRFLNSDFTVGYLKPRPTLHTYPDAPVAKDIRRAPVVTSSHKRAKIGVHFETMWGKNLSVDFVQKLILDETI